MSRVNSSDLAFSESCGSKPSRFMSLSQVCTVSCLLFLANNRNYVLVEFQVDNGHPHLDDVQAVLEALNI